jgi:hypothetical protein
MGQESANSNKVLIGQVFETLTLGVGIWTQTLVVKNQHPYTDYRMLTTIKTF